MGKKKKTRDAVEKYHPGATERHERVHRRLMAALEELKRRDAERRRAAGTG